MLYIAVKALVSGVIIAIVSEIAKRSPDLGALILSLPLISILAFIWLWRDTGDQEGIAALAQSTFWFVLPTLPLFLPGGILTGVAAGSFLAVDWALMTDIIPKASSGRYMGISNVATATNGVAAAFVGGLVIDALVRSGATDLGPRVAFLLAPVAFAIGALLLRPVDERRREDAPPSPAALETAPA